MFPEHRPLYIRTKDIDIYTGLREGALQNIAGTEGMHEHKKRRPSDWVKSGLSTVF